MTCQLLWTTLVVDSIELQRTARELESNLKKCSSIQLKHEQVKKERSKLAEEVVLVRGETKQLQKEKQDIEYQSDQHIKRCSMQLEANEARIWTRCMTGFA